MPNHVEIGATSKVECFEIYGILIHLNILKFSANFFLNQNFRLGRYKFWTYEIDDFRRFTLTRNAINVTMYYGLCKIHC